MPEPPLDPALQQMVRALALANALEHEGTASPKVVLGRLLSARPDLRPQAKALGPVVAAVAGEVSALGPAAQGAELTALGGAPPPPAAAAASKEESSRGQGLPPLQGDTRAIVMRLAPGPSGPLHLGHSRMAILNDEYCRQHGGRLLLRLEDTDPDRTMPEAYEWIAQDLRWLGVDVHETVIQSDRFELYYRHAKELLARGAAYVSTAPAEQWRQAKVEGKALPERSDDPADQLERFEGMLSGRYGTGEAVVVMKTDLQDPNPALRDWAALRISDSLHPRTGDRYRVYPLMNLAVALDDHLLGLTHVLRGKDHLNNTQRQRWVFDGLGWPLPHYVHYGRVRIDGPELSTSTMAAGIATGAYGGWDDVRLGTLRAMECRGIEPRALRRYWVEAGVNEVDVVFSWKTLYAFNRDLIDGTADRYRFVPSPRLLRLEGAPPHAESSAPLHPDHPERGVRSARLHATDGALAVAVPGQEWEELAQGTEVRLKDLATIVKVGPTSARWLSATAPTGSQRPPTLQWVDPATALPLTVARPEGTRDEGLIEPLADQATGTVVQLERYGFVALRRPPGSAGLQAGFSHR